MALILFVDDAEHLRTVICEALEISGHEVVFTGSGKEALRLCQKRNFDVVVTDIVMPEVDGLELIRALRTLRRELPIIAVSGASEEMLTIATKLGANATLQIPFDLQALLAAIDNVLRQQKSE